MVVRTQNALEALYEADETAWLDKMAELVRERRYDELDYGHLEEYLSDMAKRDRRQVLRRLRKLLVSVLQYQLHSAAQSRKWRGKILAQQQDLDRDVEAGVLRDHALNVLSRAYADALEIAAAATGLPSHTFPTTCPYSLDQLLATALTSPADPTHVVTFRSAIASD